MRQAAIERLTLEDAGRGTHPNLRPKDAATLIVLRGGREPCVLMGRRHERHVFMPGKFVFPGGRVDPGDGDVPAAEDVSPAQTERLLARMKGRPSRRRARALAMAALREAYEEAGVLVGAEGMAAGLGGDWAGFAQAGLLPAPGRLDLIARAITPPGRVRRFDTRFFAVGEEDIERLPGGLGPSGELDRVDWFTLGEARSLDLPRITAVVLDEVEARLAVPGRVRRVPFYHVHRGRFVREWL